MEMNGDEGYFFFYTKKAHMVWALNKNFCFF